MRAVEKEGPAGLLKGIGKGIGGLIMKPGAGQYHPIDRTVPKLTFPYSNLGTTRLYFPRYSQRSAEALWVKCYKLCDRRTNSSGL